MATLAAIYAFIAAYIFIAILFGFDNRTDKPAPSWWRFRWGSLLAVSWPLVAMAGLFAAVMGERKWM